MTRVNILDRIIGRAEGLQTKYRNALDKIDNEIGHLGDIQARDYSAAKITGAHTELTPTEARASAAMRLDGDKEYLTGLVRAAELALTNANREADRILGTRVVDVSRCSSTGREGAIEWSDPNCWNKPSRGPLCDKCSKAEYRWRRARNLEPRMDGVFTEPAA